jgi:hypothetical protein
MAAQMPGVTVPDDPTYDDFVRVSKEIMRGRSRPQQLALIRAVLLSLMPPGTPRAFRTLFPPTQWAAELNASLASLGFGWLVGASEVREEEVPVDPAAGATRRQRSVVHIAKCRYLESSACVGLCVNMCKVCLGLVGFFNVCFVLLVMVFSSRSHACVCQNTQIRQHAVTKRTQYPTHHATPSASSSPKLKQKTKKTTTTKTKKQLPTQAFFTEEFGLPLTMNPNFEDLSCDMVFGAPPPPLELDPAAAQACFVPQCSLAERSVACPKVEPASGG